MPGSMDGLHVAHLILVAGWGSLVAAETVVEIVGRGDAAARIHYWLDLTLEIPILIGVLATGAILTWRAWPPSTLHGVKIGCALFAIAVNLYCVAMVILRFRTGEARYDARVRWSGAAAPFGLVAAYIGLAYFLP
jgi:hypothetical protein